MSLQGTYDPDNIFAKILQGTMPCVKVYEDDVALAFMDVFPQTQGHTLVIPKASEARNFLELPAAEVGPYMQRVQKVAQAVTNALSPEGVRIVQFNGEAAGQTVYHLHFHILPMKPGIDLGEHAGGEMVSAEILEPIAQRIRASF